MDTPYKDLDAALMWWFTMSLSAARDPRPTASRLSLVRNGCDAWEQVMENRREWRLHDQLVDQLRIIEEKQEGK